jgi:hypothetical protein
MYDLDDIEADSAAVDEVPDFMKPDEPVVDEAELPSQDQLPPEDEEES